MDELKAGDTVLIADDSPICRGKVFDVVHATSSWVWVTGPGTPIEGLIVHRDSVQSTKFFVAGRSYRAHIPDVGYQIFECKHVETRCGKTIAVGISYLEKNMSGSLHGKSMTDIFGWEDCTHE